MLDTDTEDGALKKTFVFDGVEVRVTGRMASRDSRTMTGLKKTVLVEITPCDDAESGWRKWVNPDDLFAVLEAE